MPDIYPKLRGTYVFLFFSINRLWGPWFNMRHPRPAPALPRSRGQKKKRSTPR